MSVKNVQKQEESKKASDFHSQRHEDKSAQSVSSINNHIEQLDRNSLNLIAARSSIYSSINQCKKYIIEISGQTEQFFRAKVITAEEELKMWYKEFEKVQSQIKELVEMRLKLIRAFGDKVIKTKNYALEKVQEPPSDNE